MKKLGLIIVIVVCVIIFISTAAAGTLLTIRTIGWQELSDMSRIDDFASSFVERFSNNNKFFRLRETRTYEIDQTEIITAEQLSSIAEIHIKALSENVRITTESTDVEAKISGIYKSTDEINWRVIVNNDKLKIEVEYPKFGFSSQNMIMDIKIPAEYSGKVFLETLSGNCSLPDDREYSWNEFDYQGLSASLSINNASMQKLKLSTLSGSLEINKISSDLSADSLSGEIKLNFVENSMININTMSGNVYLDGDEAVPVKLTFKTLSGKLNNNGNELNLISQKDKTTIGVLFGKTDQGIAWYVETLSGNLVIS